MKYCKYCGKEISDSAKECPYCHKILETSQPSRNLKWIITLALVGLIILAVVIFSAGRCRESGCHNKSVSGSRYCYTHKCAVPDCPEKRSYGSNYCFLHSYYDSDSGDVGDYVYSSQIKVSGVKLSSSSSFTIAEGSVTNNSDVTITYLKIKGSFEDYSGNVIDTDWTYAVGSEGLAPGESCKWRMSVAKDSSIKTCDVSIQDFDY